MQAVVCSFDIACDAASRSEIVVPLLHDGRLYGVLDVDSASTDRFTVLDRVFLEAFAAILMESLHNPAKKVGNIGQTPDMIDPRVR